MSPAFRIIARASRSVEVSQANAGLIRRDLRDQQSARAALTKFSTAELVEICARAADHFLNDVLPLDAIASVAR